VDTREMLRLARNGKSDRLIAQAMGVDRRTVARYRRWAIEDLEQDVGLVYGQMGRKGLESIENVGPRLAELVEKLLHDWT
jgi:response regulator of citrate/malate metabolism